MIDKPFGLASLSESAHAVPPRDYHHDNRWSVALKRQIAFALLVYTLLMIFLVSKKLTALLGAGEGGMSILPYFLLVLLVLAVIPFARRLERKWERLGRSDLSHGGLALRYRRDVATVWGVAIGLPLATALVA